MIPYSLEGPGATALTFQTVADWYWWPMVPVVVGAMSAAAVAVAVYFANAWAARDREAREVQRALTVGDGEAARARLSAAEFAWWNSKTNPFDSRGADFQCEESLFKAFYVADASLAQLAIVLARYSKSRGRPQRQVHYRRLLGWHAVIHIAWLIWFVGAASTVNPDKSVQIPPRLSGTIGRIHDVIEMIGDHRVEQRVTERTPLRKKWWRREYRPQLTVRERARLELAEWVQQARCSQNVSDFDDQINAVVIFAEDFVGHVGSVVTDDGAVSEGATAGSGSSEAGVGTKAG